MSAERTEVLSEPSVSANLPVSVSVSVSDAARNSTSTDAPHGDAAPEGTRTDAARREVIDTRKDTASNDSARDKERGSPAGEVSGTKVRMQARLPVLHDDAQVGVQKDHVVIRDGKADLRFTGVLLATAAPTAAPEGRWEEYRIYETNGGKYVFSKVTRSVFAKEEDAHQAEVFDPSPSTMPSQLMRSAREIALARPMTWMDAAVAYFGYNSLAKALYRKLSVRFEEEID